MSHFRPKVDPMTSATKRITSLEETTIIDHETGVVTKEERVRTTNVPKEPPYVKMYIEDLSKILSIRPGPQNLLHLLASSADYENVIELTSRKRERMCVMLGITKQSFANYLFYLKKVDVIRDLGGQELMLNPHYFAKGNWIDIERQRSTYLMTVTYTPDGQREITGTLVPVDSVENQ